MSRQHQQLYYSLFIYFYQKCQEPQISEKAGARTGLACADREGALGLKHGDNTSDHDEEEKVEEEDDEAVVEEEEEAPAPHRPEYVGSKASKVSKQTQSTT